MTRLKVKKIMSPIVNKSIFYSTILLYNEDYIYYYNKDSLNKMKEMYNNLYIQEKSKYIMKILKKGDKSVQKL